jgi:hypothetical protein
MITIRKSLGDLVSEPLRDLRRLFGLSHAALAG